MNKFTKVAIALLAIAAVAAPAVAEDRLTLNGQARVRTFMTDQDDTTKNWSDQRFRLGGKVAVADGVSFTFRQDFSEQNMGTDAGFGRQNIHVDRAHLDIDTDMFHIRGGQQYVGLGNFALDTQNNGIVVDLKLPAPVKLAYLVTGDEDMEGADSEILAASVSHKTDMYSASVFFAMANNQGAAAAAETAYKQIEKDLYAKDLAKYTANELKDNGVPNPSASDTTAQQEADAAAQKAWVLAQRDAAGIEKYNSATWDVGTALGGVTPQEVMALGLDTTLNLDAIKVRVSAASFSGTAFETTYNDDWAKEKRSVDAVGTQLAVDANMDMDGMTVGGAFYYALAADTKTVQQKDAAGALTDVYLPKEVQVTSVGNGFNGYDPTNFGPLSNEKLGGPKRRVFDFTGTSSGVIGAQAYGKATFAGVGATASVAYLMPEDDKQAKVDSQIETNVGATYGVADNTTLAAQVRYVMTDDDADTEDLMAAGVALTVAF